VTPLHRALQLVRYELRAVLDAVERSGADMDTTLVVNAHSSLSDLDQVDLELRQGAPSRRMWSVGQATVPVLRSLLNGLAKHAGGAADVEVEHCRTAVDSFDKALVAFAEGRETPVVPADIELVIFDCDGVLVDSELLSITIIAELIRDAGVEITVEDVGDRFIGRSHEQIVTSLTEDFGGPPPQTVLDFEETVLAAFPARLQPVPGIAGTLTGLVERSMKICVGSNSDVERLEISLGVTGLVGSFRDGWVFSSEMVAHPKPAPDLYLHAASVVGVQPGQCLVIEDSVPGVTAGVAAGMRVAGFIGGSHARPPLAPRLLAAGAERIIERPEEILELVAGPAEDGATEVADQSVSRLRSALGSTGRPARRR
jgi:HAD superfamily hydrolase (TIGR01509 family)